jgi:hypothetical protein
MKVQGWPALRTVARDLRIPEKTLREAIECGELDTCEDFDGVLRIEYLSLCSWLGQKERAAPDPADPVDHIVAETLRYP